MLRDLAALQERIKLLQDEIAAQVGEHTNSSVFTLTVVTVLALPINLVAGLLGMNVGGIPLAQHPHGFLDRRGRRRASPRWPAGWRSARRAERAVSDRFRGNA